MVNPPTGPHKNPSTTFFWNDWDNDEALKACSLAAQGLWMRCLCIAARSPEPGIVMIGGFPASRSDIAPRIAAVVGRSLDEVNALLDELLTSGTASLDRKGRIINRRMVKAAALHKKRSESGRAGAAASARSRTGMSQAEGQLSGGQEAEIINDVNHGETTTIDSLPRQTDRQTASKPAANRSANGVASSRLQDFSSSESPPETTEELSHLTEPISESAQEVSGGLGVPEFLRRPGSRTAEPIQPDWLPSRNTQDYLASSRPDLTVEIIERRMREFRLWCATSAITSHNPDATWFSFMVKTYVQRSNSNREVRADQEDPNAAGVGQSLARRHLLARGLANGDLGAAKTFDDAGAARDRDLDRDAEGDA